MLRQGKRSNNGYLRVFALCYQRKESKDLLLVTGKNHILMIRYSYFGDSVLISNTLSIRHLKPASFKNNLWCFYYREGNYQPSRISVVFADNYTGNLSVKGKKNIE